MSLYILSAVVVVQGSDSEVEKAAVDWPATNGMANALSPWPEGTQVTTRIELHEDYGLRTWDDTRNVTVIQHDSENVTLDSATSCLIPPDANGHVDIPAGDTIIPDNAFAFCTALRSINIPGSVTRIGRGAFVFCENLEMVTIAHGVKSIGEGAFFLKK